MPDGGAGEPAPSPVFEEDCVVEYASKVGDHRDSGARGLRPPLVGCGTRPHV